MENLYFYATIRFHVVLSILAFHHLSGVCSSEKEILSFGACVCTLPATLLVYATKTQVGFSVVGLTVAVAMVGAVVLEYTVDKDKETPKELTENSDDSTGNH